MTTGDGTNLRQFQLTQDSIKSKSDKAYGLSISQYINNTIQGGTTGYYFNRNARFRQNRNSANGRINMSRFQDYMEFNGKTNYANLNWQSIRIVNRIISGLVGRWMNRSEKIQVKATDPLSVNQKKKEYDNIELILYNRQQLEQLQQESGAQQIPQGMQIPADKEELALWATQIQRLPEEIIYEMGINDVLSSNGWFDVNKEQALHDSAEDGFVGTWTWMDDEGVIHVDPVYPENAIYSFSRFNDFRDTTWRGQVTSIKISELRSRFGKEFNPDDPLALTEQQLFEIASTAKEYQLTDKLTWNQTYNFLYMRPYDEWNVEMLHFELRTVDNETYTVVTTKKNKSTFIKKGKPAKKSDNEEVREDSKVNIYEGFFLRYQNLLLKWGLKKNMIRPQDPQEIGNAELSFSFYMYQNYKMRNVAIPEKIEEPADQMILARLKMQQLVAKMRPTGAAYDVDAMQEIDLGLAGGPSKPSELQRIYDQTGNLYYRGRDAEGNPIHVPIQELANSGFLNQMEGLIKLYAFHYQVLKDELGEDPALMSSALQPRVTEGNVNTAQEVAANATDYVYMAYSEVMKQTSKKIACLLKDSVEYGSNAYRAMIKEDDIKGRVFGTEFMLLPDAQQILRFEAMLNNTVTANPDISLFINPFQLMELAKEDVKLAWVLFERGQKKMLLDRQQQAAQNSQMNAQAQQQSIEAKAKADAELKQMEIEMKGQADIALSKEKQIEIMMAGIFGMREKGVDVGKWSGVEDEIIKNIGIPLFAQNVQQARELQQGMQDAAQEQGQPEGQEQQPPQGQEIQQPQQQMQPEMAA